MSKIEVNAIFISDIHLGTIGCKPDHLLEFLGRYKTKKLFLVGDIVDGWRIQCKFFWTKEQTAVLQKFLKMSKQGTEVIWISGNHDEFLRHFSHFGLQFDNIQIVDEYLYPAINGKNYWVVHGDIFDSVIRYSGFIGHMGDKIYNLLINFNHYYNSGRRILGLEYWSLSKHVKGTAKKAVQYIGNYSDAVVAGTKKKACDGVICGHIHYPEIRTIGNIEYMNTGDWVDYCSGLIEHEDGSFELIKLLV